MDTMKEAICKIEDLVRQSMPVVEIDSDNGIKRKLYDGEEYTNIPCTPDVLRLSTLSGLCDYLLGDYDQDNKAAITTIVVRSPESVTAYSDIKTAERRRETIVDVTAVCPEGFPFGRYLYQPDFIIGLQTKFVVGEADWDEVCECVGRIKQQESDDFADDGVTQTVMIQRGVALAKRAAVPNPVRLKPFRTFCDVEQPVSPFVLRVQTDVNNIPMLALFEADGGAWRLEAMRNIKYYLNITLEGYPAQILA